MLRNNVVPAVRALNANFEQIYFQQDGCPVHNSRRVRNFLDATFPNRLIATYGTIKWPPRSPDLSPNDFFLWGHVKQAIYRDDLTRPQNLEDLRARVGNRLASIPPETLSDTRMDFYNRLGYCLFREGDLFEHNFNQVL